MVSAPGHSANHGPRLGLAGLDCCLDFANSRNRGPFERYHSLLAWARAADVVTEHEADQLAEAAATHPSRARRATTSAEFLREVIHRVFLSIAAGQRPEAEDMAALNDSLAKALSHVRLVDRNGSFTWTLQGSSDDLDCVVWPVVRSAADLLTSQWLDRVRPCAAVDCGWLFIDRSPSGTRRWCSMKTCGNRHKVRRHYHRKKNTADP